MSPHRFAVFILATFVALDGFQRLADGLVRILTRDSEFAWPFAWMTITVYLPLIVPELIAALLVWLVGRRIVFPEQPLNTATIVYSGSKIIGIYLFTQAIMATLHLFNALFVYHSPKMTHTYPGLLAATMIRMIAYLAMGWLLCFRTRPLMKWIMADANPAAEKTSCASADLDH